MNLEVDMGNTRLKWRLVDNQQVVTRGSVANKDIIDEKSFNELLLALNKHPLSKVGVSSVSGRYRSLFDRWCEQKLGLVPRYLEVSRCDAGVVNGYSHIEQMGIDRWLAMLAVYSTSDNEACLVIDCGSACTLDMVLVDGRHLGGYIVPGLYLMKDALFRDTDRVKLEGIGSSTDLSPGKTTQDAVSSGLWLMQLGIIKLSLDRLSAENVNKLYIVFTGGDGEHLLSLFKQQLLVGSHKQIVSRVEFRPDLVLDGVSLLLNK